MNFNNSSPEYLAYIKSARWNRKRSLVLSRDRRLCQGCFEHPATEVHHLTYEHVYDELLYELISLCDDCHDRAHDRQIGKRKLQPNKLMRSLEHLESNIAAARKQESGNGTVIDFDPTQQGE